jgi:3-keto-disaccharide hydrolase
LTGSLGAVQSPIMNLRRSLTLLGGALVLLGAGSASDMERNAWPPPSPRPATPPGQILFSDTFSDSGLAGWKPDRAGVWTVRHGVLRADLPDERQQKSFLYAGSSRWTNYALDVDVCAMRGADKGVAVRVVEGETGIAVDLRGPGYQDVLLNRREWPLAKARVINANAQWHHVRIEARGQRYRVWVNGAVVIDKEDSRKSRASGGIALAAYTGGVAESTLYFDNVVVTSLGASGGAAAVGE